MCKNLNVVTQVTITILKGAQALIFLLLPRPKRIYCIVILSQAKLMRSSKRLDLDCRIPNKIKYYIYRRVYLRTVLVHHYNIITVVHSYILNSNNTQQIFKTCQKIEQTRYYTTQLGDTPARITCQPRPCSTCSLVPPPLTITFPFCSPPSVTSLK